MAEAIFGSIDLTPRALFELAKGIGLDIENFDAALADARLDRQLDSTNDWVESGQLRGPPQIWIDGVPIVGLQTPSSLNAASNRVVARNAGKISRNHGGSPAD